MSEIALYAKEPHPIRKGSVAKVTQFIIRRSPKKTIPVCLGILEDEMGSVGEMPAEQIAVSLLDERAGESWDVVKAFVSSQMERGRRVLKTFAYGEWDRHDESHRFVDMMTAGQLGELVMLLIELFPPENDSNSDGFHTVDADSSARRLRDRMISYLGDLESYDAVEALKEIERRFGTRYPWLRRPRARAERAYTLSQWTPFRVDVVARIIGTANKRLIGSDEDVVDGIADALERYEEKLRQDTGESAEDLWNTSAGIAPSPKSEEHVASKLCGAVRSYFQDYAISADREVQIHRRSVPRVLGGETGSEVDILVQVPGSGTTSGRRIRIPIEVKLSSNVGAKTAMQDQLVDRYIFQLGATYGVYVVVWMSAPDRDTLQPHHRPRWPSIEVMRDELDEDARRLSEDRGVYVRAVAVDGSLR